MTRAGPGFRPLPALQPHRRHAVTAPAAGGHGPNRLIVVHWTPEVPQGRPLHADRTGQRHFLLLDDCAQEVTATGREPLLRATALP